MTILPDEANMKVQVEQHQTIKGSDTITRGSHFTKAACCMLLAVAMMNPNLCRFCSFWQETPIVSY